MPASDTMTTVARFLALLELFREGVVAFDQVTPLGELTIRWTGDDDAEVTLTASRDTFEGILNGDTNPTMAYMSGKLKIDGDMALALKLGAALS